MGGHGIPASKSLWIGRFFMGTALTWILWRGKEEFFTTILHTKHDWDDNIDTVEKYTWDVENLALDQLESRTTSIVPPKRRPQPEGHQSHH